MSARLRTSPSSAARAAMVVLLEDATELLGGVDDRVRLLDLEPLPVVDPTPRHGNREHPLRLRRTDVERRIADVRRPGRIRFQPRRREQERLWIGLVTQRLVAAHDRLEEVPERHSVERKLDGRAALRGDDAEPAALLAQP